MQGDKAQIVKGLYTQHRSWLLGWLRGKLGNADHAADLTQDTFVRILVRPQDLRQIREPRSFLTTIAGGLVIDHWRRRTIEQAWIDALAHQPLSVHPSPERQAELLAALCRVDAMLTSLSDRARRAFIYAQIHGMTYLEISKVLGVSDRMVKKYMAQAMLRCLELQAELDQEEGSISWQT